MNDLNNRQVGAGDGMARSSATRRRPHAPAVIPAKAGIQHIEVHHFQ